MQFDKALAIMAAQGVVIDRDLGDGRAFLTVEPKFYNWCGTRGFKGRWWDHWAGGYFACPLSSLLVHAEYAAPALDEPGLTGKDRWRLEGADQLRGDDVGPMRISTQHDALRFDGSVSSFGNLDEILEGWKPAPAE